MPKRTKRGNGSVRFDAKSKCFIGRLSVVINGQRYRPSVTGKSHSECMTAMRRLHGKMLTGEHAVKQDAGSLYDYLISWLEVSRFESSTLLRYETILKKIVGQQWFARLKLQDVRPEHILRLYRELGSESDSTRNKAHTLMHAAFEDARHVRRILNNPCDLPKKQKPKYVRPDVRPLNETQEAAFLAAIVGDTNEAMYLLALDSGARQGELWALDWEDVDFTRKRIRIRQTLKDAPGCIKVGPTKGKAERVITVSEATVSALAKHKELVMSDKLVFPNIGGGYLCRQNFNRRDWIRILKKAGLEKTGFTFHDLRHTCATMLLRSGESIANVSQRLGDSKISTTLDYYTHALPQDDARSAGAFEGRLRRYLS